MSSSFSPYIFPPLSSVRLNQFFTRCVMEYNDTTAVVQETGLRYFGIFVKIFKLKLVLRLDFSSAIHWCTYVKICWMRKKKLIPRGFAKDKFLGLPVFLSLHLESTHTHMT